MTQDPVLKGKIISLAGAYEFLKEDEPANAATNALSKLVKAFSLMPYSTVFIAPNEAQAFKKAGITPPSGFVEASSEAKTQTISIKGVTAGIIFFPMLDAKASLAPQKALKAVAKAASDLRSQHVDIIIGLSTWGAQIERDYLDHGNTDVDILLGSGQGFGFNARPMANGHVLWARGFFQRKGNG